ncbi:sensor domain-containing diguanylate cyclase [Anaerostipes sp.]|uniref:sensor domain-containing diguanylate cyclase n=1 Tax=Anaerostipes sp. TaxID=1872530 RepID=UPI0025BB8E31|nr:diguanylate cyclase [Anaerostipes sp.]MBS7008085.1 diguanylate cyclase [Anaerostipes sp.]
MEQKMYGEGFSEDILKSMDIGMSMHRMDEIFTVIWGNEAFYRLAGCTEEEFLLWFPDLKQYGRAKMQDFGPMIQHFQNAYGRGERSAEYEMQMPGNQGSLTWVKITGTFGRPDEDETGTVYLVYTDINELKLKQTELLQREEERTKNFEWMLSEYAGNVYISDMDTYELLYLNKHSCNTLQTTEDKLVGRKCYEAIQGRNAPCPFCTNEYLNKDEAYEWEFFNPNLKRTFMIKDRMLNWNGHRARIELSYDMYSTEYKLAKKDQEREAILKTIPAGMIRIDARDHRSVLWCNDIFLDMIEYTKEQFEEELHNRCAYMHPDDFKRASLMAQDMKKTGENAVLEVRAYTRSKEERIWTVTLCYVSGEDSWDGIPTLYSIGLDITAERRKMEKLQHRAEKDALTGIYNRAETEKQIRQYLAENEDTMNALFMIDTDNFKQINDTKGHMTGDTVLSAMASGMKKLMRSSDVVGRIGGDEFTVFMKNISSQKDAEKRGKELLNMFRHLFENDKNPVNITCSIGIAVYPRDGRNFKELFVKADKALYQAKSRGKNNYVIYGENSIKGLEDNTYVSLRTEIDSEKRYAESSDNLTRYVFRILYQSENVDEAVDTALEIVGKQFDVSRAYVFENSDDSRYTSNTYEWCSEGVSPEIANLQNCDYADYGDYIKLFGEDSIFYCRDIHTLAPEQEALFSAQGIHSTLQCAFWDDGVFQGFVGFDECTGLRLWTQEEVSTLSLIAQILSIFLQKKKAKRVHKEMQQYQTVLNSLGDCIFVVEEHGILLYGNQKFRDTYPEYRVGELCRCAAEGSPKMPIIWDRKEAYLCIQ